MLPLSIRGYLALGYNILYFRHVNNRTKVHGDLSILSAIDITLKQFDQYNLKVTKSASSDLIRFQTTLKNTPANYTLTSAQVSELHEIIEKLEQVLFAESNITLAYILTDKRIDINKLTNDCGALFSTGIFNKLPDIAQYDFREAGKCIAFERPTAAAFHLLRGTESVLRYFYNTFVKRNRIRNLLWGPITDSLRIQKRPPPEVLLNNLDNIRLSYRNPTQHPEKIYSIDEAQDLFALCEDVVNQMMSLI